MTWNAVKRLCGIFCCPPCPARIAAKLAFMPPAPTYAVIDDISADGVVKKKLELTEEAEWQFTQRELDCIEPFVTRTSRGETIACIYIHCYPHAKYTILFRYLLPSLSIWRTAILGYPTILNFTYLIQLLTMSLRCLLRFFRELFGIRTLRT